MESYNISDSNDVKLLIDRCNLINQSPQGLDIDTVEDYIKWKLYNIVINNGSFTINLLDKSFNIEYQLIHTEMKNDINDTPLFVIPGFSDKSICWTIGRINRYISEYNCIFQKYSDIYIINVENVKKAMSKFQKLDGFERNNFDTSVNNHIDKILSMIYKKHNNKRIVILARSAGGGQGILLLLRNKNEGKIKSIYLMAPGYKNTGFTDEDKKILNEMNKNNPLPITMAFVNQDTRVNPKEIKELRRVLEDEINYSNFTYVEINRDESIIGDGDRDRHFHRFQPELIKLL